MIKKQNKLNLANYLTNTNNIYKIINHRHFTLFIYKNNLNYPRIGVLITKKILNKATLRNKIKRIILNYSQKMLKLKNNYGFDFLFKIKPEIKNIAKQQLYLELNSIFEKL